LNSERDKNDLFKFDFPEKTMSGFFSFSNFLKPPDPPDLSKGAGSGRKRNQSQSSTVSSISTTNSYQTLRDNVEEPEAQPVAASKRRRKKKASQETEEDVDQEMEGDNGDEGEFVKKDPKPPPTTVKNINITDLNEIMAGFKIPSNNISLRLTQYGIKLFVTTTEEFKTLKSFLQEKALGCYTHQLKEDKKSKFVLYGIPNFDEAVIKSELANYDLNPSDIKKLKNS
jgi:hypothetical protein